MNNKMNGYSCIGLYNPKYPANIGGTIRSAAIFSSKFVGIVGTRYKHHKTDTGKFYHHLPVFQVENLQNIIPYGCTPVAVDILDDAIPLHKYNHPKQAFYIFGPEDSTLNSDILSWCKDKIYVPTLYCMNLASTVTVILYDRFSKQMIKNE